MSHCHKASFARKKNQKKIDTEARRHAQNNLQGCGRKLIP